MPSPVNNNEENEPPKTYQPLTLKVDPANIDTPPTNLRTPVKSLSQGYHFNSHQYSHTPTTRPHIGLLSGVVSPQLHTPKSGSVSRTAQLCRQPRSGDSSAKSTPRFTTPGGTAHHVVRNPFESPGQAEQLNDHVFSPNCFKQNVPDSAEKTPQTFRWSIDQIALLNPADINEMPIQQDTVNIRKDRRTEARLQKTLDSYFSQEVVPSPLSHPPPKHVLPQTPGSHNTPSPMVDYLRETGRHGNKEVEKKTQCNVSVQTALTLPTSFDLEKLLGEHYTHKESAEEDVADSSMRSENGTASTSADTSSLRRKLFFQGDVGTPLSPVRQQRHSLEERYTPRDPQAPNAAQFSSSPIRPNEKTPLRRCSTAPDLDMLASPLVSPIIHDEVAENNEGGDGPMHATPSPLALGVSSGQRSRRTLDVSPIHQGSFIDSLSHSREDERAHCRSHSPPPSLHYSPQHVSHPEIPPCSPASPPLSPSQSLFSQHRSGLLKLSDLDDGVSLLSECDPTTSQESQDTGYNTESGTHTNLTTQFGQLLESSTLPKPILPSPKLFTMDTDDNAIFETAIPICKPQQQHRSMSINRQISEPTHLSEFPSLHSSQTESDLMRSLPESLLGASIPISISRTPSVSYELSTEQVLNESSPPALNASMDIPSTPSDADVFRRARRVLGMDSPMEQGSPAVRSNQGSSQGSSEVVKNLPGGVEWYMQGTDTPIRQSISGMARKLERRHHDVKNMLPSEMAYEVIKKAGVDYNKVISGQQLDDTGYEYDDHTDMSFTTS